MNRSATSTLKFWPGAVVVYAVALTVGALSASPLLSYAHDQAASYARDATHQTSTATSLLELQTAQTLDPGNPSYRQQLADHYVAQGDLNQAVDVLGSTSSERVRKANLLIRLGHPSQAVTTVQGVAGSDAAVARSSAYLEEGSRGESAAAAVQGVNGDAAVIQLALCDASANDAIAIQPLIAQASSPDIQQRLRRIESGGVVLAQELYANDLYQTAQRVLATVPDSSAKATLLAHIWLSHQPLTHQDLMAAQTAAQQGIILDPSSLPMYLLLQNIDSQLGDKAGVAHEQELINQLQTGKI
jgi:thioredoxin-like negative regulator of GroEL